MVLRIVGRFIVESTTLIFDRIMLNICSRINELAKISSRTPAEMQEEISVTLLTDLQEKQATENCVVEKHLIDKVVC